LILTTACVVAGGVWAQSTDASVAADRARSNALTSEQRGQAQRLFQQSFELLRSGDIQAAQFGFERGLALDPGGRA